jgi:SAM-dependent methyltransferase
VTQWLPKSNRIWDANDHCLGFFEQFWTAGRIVLPRRAKVLEVGCAEADWLTTMKARRPDLHLTGVDQRGHPPRPGADVLLRGNILDAGLFPAASFDVIVAISVIEHVGIGRYGDVKDADGDTMAMANIKQWLKPDGFLYMDVPYRGEGPSDPFRAYSEVDLQRRVIAGWRETDREVYEVDHPDAPYIALVLRPV